MKIAFFEIKDREREVLKKSLNKHKLYFFSEVLNEKNAYKVKDADIVSIFIYSKITKSLLVKFRNLSLIATRSTGFDNIDLRACKRRNIAIANVPTYGENTVAEHAFALILSLSRNIHKAYLRTLKKDYTIDGLNGFDLKGKTLGVIGTGHIGQNVIRIAKGFQMSILAYDKIENKNLEKNLDFKYTSLDNLFKKSDIITLHVPLTPMTHHLINKFAFQKFKKSAILINTSRGEIIDSKSLLEAIEKGRIAGAGLDVIEGEDLIKEEKRLLHKENPSLLKKVYYDYKIIKNEKVVFTPHIGYYSNEALDRILQTTISNINNFIKNKPYKTLKNV